MPAGGWLWVTCYERAVQQKKVKKLRTYITMNFIESASSNSDMFGFLEKA
jgi:hypothetical protein